MDDYLGISPKTSNEFKVTETGELERAVRPFSRNIRIDEFDNFNESHKKRAQKKVTKR